MDRDNRSIWLKTLTSALLLAVLSLSSFSQKQATKWYFGKHAGLDFSNGAPVLLTGGSIDTDEGCATMSDKNGNLLFYTDGETVWNRNHQPMPNGTGLMGGYTSTQSALAIPFPGNDSLFYLFTVSQEDRTHGFRYSVVNMKKDNGLGDIVTKNVELLNPAYEKLSGVRHRNCSDYWIVTRKWNSDEYHAYLITPTGISSPVISKTSNVIGGAPTNSRGQLKFSPDGTKAAAAHNIRYDYVELMDFDNLTGQFSNTIKLVPNAPFTETSSIGVYGVEFSPNSKLLYITSTYGFSIPQTHLLHQYNVSLSSPAAIINSKKLIDNTAFCYGMQLGPDKRIYVARNYYYADVIASPDIEGPGCGYTKDAIFLGTSGELDFPSFIQSYFKDPIIAAGNCEFQNISFSIEGPNNFLSVEWDFGDPASGVNNTSTLLAPVHIFSQQGDYKVRLITKLGANCEPDTFYKNVHAGPFKVFLGNDTAICRGDTLMLRMNIPNAFNVWNNGTTDTLLKLTGAGTYWVRVASGNCVASDTINVTIRELPVFSLGKDTTICNNQSVTLKPVPDYSGATYLWNTGATVNQISATMQGKYWLVLKDSYGCAFRDTIQVNTSVLPNFTLGNDISVCQGVNVILSASVPGAQYLWNTGATANQIQPTTSNIYWLDATLNGCTYRDSVTVQFKPLPVVFIGKDTVLCETNILLLDASNAGASYKWSDNSTGQTLMVKTKGTYAVTVTKNECSTSDTIAVDYKFKPKFTLGADQLICDGMFIRLKPSHISGAIEWNNGSDSASLMVSRSGVYYADITNQCGVTRDSIIVSKGLCKLRVPNAFSPNNDRINQVFKAKGDGITEFEMQIFNRWGQRIFYSKDISKGWDGTFKGIAAPVGGYVWMIKYKEYQSSEYALLKGTVLLLR
jgi:gliding motility-associated-like protein